MEVLTARFTTSDLRVCPRVSYNVSCFVLWCCCQLLYPSSNIAARLHHGPLCHCCIWVAPDVSSWTYVLSGFLVKPYSFLVLDNIVPYAVQEWQGLKFTNVYVLNMGTIYLLDGVCMSGQTCLNDSECSERPSTGTSDVKQEQVRAMILKDSNKCKVFQHITKWI